VLAAKMSKNKHKPSLFAGLPKLGISNMSNLEYLSTGFMDDENNSTTTQGKQQQKQLSNIQEDQATEEIPMLNFITRTRADSNIKSSIDDDIEVLKLSELLNEELHLTETSDDNDIDAMTSSISSTGSEDVHITITKPHGESKEVSGIYEELNRSLDKTLYNNTLKRSHALKLQMQSKELDALRAAMQCIYLPLHSQMEKKDSYYALPSYEKELGDLHSNLLETLQNAFEPQVTDTQFNKLWEQVACIEQLSKNCKIDPTFAILAGRLDSCNKKVHPYYTLDNFKNTRAFEDWKVEEKRQVDSLMTDLNRVREQEFSAIIKVGIQEVQFSAKSQNLNACML